MLSCSIWFYVPSFWMGSGLESRCVGRVYGADGARHFGILHYFMRKMHGQTTLKTLAQSVILRNGLIPFNPSPLPLQIIILHSARTRSNIVYNKTGNARINITSKRVRVTTVSWKSSKYFI